MAMSQQSSECAGRDAQWVALEAEELDTLLKTASIRGNGKITARELADAFELLVPEVVLLWGASKEAPAKDSLEHARPSDSDAQARGYGVQQEGQVVHSGIDARQAFDRRVAEVLALVGDITASGTRVRQASGIRVRTASTYTSVRRKAAVAIQSNERGRQARKKAALQRLLCKGTQEGPRSLADDTTGAPSTPDEVTQTAGLD